VIPRAFALALIHNLETTDSAASGGASRDCGTSLSFSAACRKAVRPFGSACCRQARDDSRFTTANPSCGGLAACAPQSYERLRESLPAVAGLRLFYLAKLAEFFA